mgnify:CR=1 FL=1
MNMNIKLAHIVQVWAYSKSLICLNQNYIFRIYVLCFYCVFITWHDQLFQSYQYDCVFCRRCCNYFRGPAIKAMNTMGRTNISMASLFNVMSTPPVLNKYAHIQSLILFISFTFTCIWIEHLLDRYFQSIFRFNWSVLESKRGNILFRLS